MSEFTVETHRLLTHAATLVMVSHPQYGRTKVLVDDMLTQQARTDLLAQVQQQLERTLLAGSVARRAELHAILQTARVAP